MKHWTRVLAQALTTLLAILFGDHLAGTPGAWVGLLGATGVWVLVARAVDARTAVLREPAP